MRTSKLRNEKGFTLIELLVAVAIFVIAVVPILYAFVYSTSMNFKAQEVLQSTGIAQAIIEKCKAQNDLNPSFASTYDDTADFIKKSLTASPGGTGTGLLDNTEFVFSSLTPGGASNVYIINDVRKGGILADSGRGVYDVRVTFNPAPTSAVVDQSKVDVMSTSDCAVFCDVPADGIDISYLRTMDSLAANEFASRIISNLNTPSASTITQVSKSVPTAPNLTSDQMRAIFTANPSDIKLEKLVIKRTVYLDITDYKVVMRVDYQFMKAFDTTGALSDKYNLVKEYIYNGCVYKISCKAGLSGSDLTYTGHANGDDTKTSFKLFDKTSTAVQPRSLYFYYYPAYDYSGNRSVSRTYQTGADYAGLCNIEDHFVITNGMTNSNAKDIDIYLFKQFNSGLNASVFQRGENYYLPKIDITTNSAKDTNLYHNLFLYANDGTEITNGNSFASAWKNTGVANCVGKTGSGTLNYKTTYESVGGGSPEMTDILPKVEGYIPYYSIRVEVWRNNEMDSAGKSALEIMEGDVLNR